MTDTGPRIPVSEYAERRARVLDALEGAAAVVMAGRNSRSGATGARRTSDAYFWYLTGIDSEPGAAVLFDPSAEDEGKRVCLFLAPRDPETEMWDGPRPSLDSEYKKRTGFTSLARTDVLPARLTQAARRTKRLACLHPFASYDSDLSPDLAVLRKVCERVPTAAIEDRTQLLTSLRAVKSASELALIQQAIAITEEAFQLAFQSVRPGAGEGEVAEAMTGVYRARAAVPAFEPIVGYGANSTILHYTANDAIIGEDGLVVIDYGAAFGGYAADVTRTLPASGTFSQAQRELYEVVLEANLAAIEAALPGTSLTEVNRAASAVIAEAGYEDYFPHGVSHHLGIEVHDPAPDGPLVPGMVITIEPGVYLPHKDMGVRIEDDILITDSRPRVLTEAIPKTVAAIEAAMQRRSEHA